jgi:hypothetical protein
MRTSPLLMLLVLPFASITLTSRCVATHLCFKAHGRMRSCFLSRLRCLLFVVGIQASLSAFGQQSLGEILKELKTISLSEAQLRQLAGSTGFKSYALNPILTPGKSSKGEWDAGALGTPCVIKVGGIYHMYYESWGKLSKEGTHAEYMTLQIGHAVSVDGVHWAKDPSNPVVPRGLEGQWDHGGTWDPFVIYEDGLFKMWYGGNDGGQAVDRCEWGYATSTDGVHFVKQAQLSHLGGVEDDRVVHDRQRGEYFMFYWDRDKADWNEVMKGPPSAPSGLFVARSNNETNFDFAHAVRLTIQGQPWPGKYSQVIRDHNRWVMFYGEAKLRGIPSQSGMAVSDDLLTWKKVAFPLIRGHDASVIEAAPDLWLMFYGPEGYFDMPECDIRLALFKGNLDALAGIK